MTDARTISYGDDPSQYGELSLPDGTPRGVVVVVHGGFWKAEYDLSLGRPLAASLVGHGWAAWNLEYRRVGPAGSRGAGGGSPTTLDDVAAGIDRLADLELDLGTVVALGHSAGGHLAAWAASRRRFARWEDGVDVTAVISQAGVLDLRAAYVEGLGGGAVEALLGHPPGPGDDPADPARQVPLDVPLWCVHGRADDIVPISQSRGYVESATAAGARAELVEVEGDHFVVIDTGSEAWRRTLAILDALA
ncbi:alpha/beta hydrolase family protein [Nocardioides sp. MAHUQ-72]|uniref:alpha/beta hydrolase family protein n=1 Tax=unclassified Nocardioides TaxID=2615069 RepID=UPI00361155DA